MSKTVKKVQIALVVFGLFVVCYNIFEFITNKYSTTQGITFIIESLAGIVLIFLPQIMKKLFHLHIPDAIVLFYWFFLFISVFLGTGMHLISIISFWDKILHAVSPMVLTALGYGLIGLLLKKRLSLKQVLGCSCFSVLPLLVYVVSFGNSGNFSAINS